MNIIANNAIYDMNKVGSFLNILFDNDVTIDVKPSNNILLLDVKNSSGVSLKKADLPVNIKDRDSLGWYSSDHNLCLLPLKNGKFLLKIGCNKNKPIRPITATFVDK